MLNFKDFFVKTNIKLNPVVIDTILKDLPDIEFIGNKEYAINYSKPLSNQLTFDNQLDEFVKEFSPLIVLLKIDPFTHVPWHLDENSERKSTINIMVSNSANNNTYFTDATTYEDLNYKKFNTWLCPYEYGVPVLMNVTQKLHCVFNCSAEHRLLLSICTKKISHAELVDWFDTRGCTQ
jgi:hypothetical protein